MIGASAGGVEALSVLLPALPTGLPVSVFVVLHLPRERPSLLVEIFSHKCQMAVREAQDKEPVQASTIYFAPPDYHLLIDGGPPHLALSIDAPVHYSRPSIDVLFESAADVYRERLIGIVLTGANEDGAAGLAAVHAAGGYTLAESPATAQSRYMPEAAIKRSPVHAVLALAPMAELLRTLAPSAAAPSAAHPSSALSPSAKP